MTSSTPRSKCQKRREKQAFLAVGKPVVVSEFPHNLKALRHFASFLCSMDFCVSKNYVLCVFQRLKTYFKTCLIFFVYVYECSKLFSEVKDRIRFGKEMGGA